MRESGLKSLISSGVQLCELESCAAAAADLEAGGGRSVSKELRSASTSSPDNSFEFNAVDDDAVLEEGDILTFSGPLRAMTDIVYVNVYMLGMKAPPVILASV